MHKQWLWIYLLCALPLAAGEASRRVLWNIDTSGGPDRFVEIVPAQGKFLAVRKGVLYAFDAQTGEIAWKFPALGKGWDFTDSTRSRTAPVIQGIFGDEVITLLPLAEGSRGQGRLAIKLATGEVSRRIKLGGEFKFARSLWNSQFSGKQIVFSNTDQKTKRTLVAIFDLEAWKETQRFELPLHAYEDMHVCHGMLLGTFDNPDAKFKWAFALDIDKAELWKLPVRYTHGVVLLADGTRIFRDGVIGPKCNYRASSRVNYAADGIGYVRDHLGVEALDLGTGKELWKLSLGHWPESLLASGDFLAIRDKQQVHIVDRRTGAMRASIQAFNGIELGKNYSNDVLMAGDGERLLVAWPFGLTAYSLVAVDPRQIDAADPGDPAYYIARTRAALAAGDLEQAMAQLRGISVSMRLRPEQRLEAAELFSQIARSEVPSLFPRTWTELMLADGWIAGELFVSEFERLAPENEHAVAALIQLGAQKHLKAAAAILDRRSTGDYEREAPLVLAARAEEILAGAWPAQKIMGRGHRYDFRVLLSRPLDMQTLKQVLPELKKRDQGQLKYELHSVPPEQFLMLASPNSELLGAAQLQLESQRKGEGQREAVPLAPSPEKAVVPPRPPSAGEF